MQHLVFIVGGYYPNFSPVGNCAFSVIKHLKADYRITVLAINNDLSYSSHELFDGYDIYRVSTKNYTKRNVLLHRITRRKSPVDKFLYNCLRARIAIAKLLSKTSVDQQLVDAYLQELESLKPTIDFIIPLVFPFESVLAALQYRESHSLTKVIPYFFDDFLNNTPLHVLALNKRLKYNRHMKLYQYVLKSAATILAMPQLKATFSSIGSSESAIQYLEHPLLEKKNTATNYEITDTIRLSYTGGFFKGLREPDYLLKLLSDMPPNIQTHFYVNGNCSRTIDQYAKLPSHNITNHGFVPKTAVEIAQDRSDILLNVGEIEGRLVSSKIFEYMSRGKPIVHLAYVKNDAISDILAKYPLALCLTMNHSNFVDNQNEFRRFVVENKAALISFDEVKKLFPEALPETTSSIIHHILQS